MHPFCYQIKLYMVKQRAVHCFFFKLSTTLGENSRLGKMAHLDQVFEARSRLTCILKKVVTVPLQNE